MGAKWCKRNIKWSLTASGDVGSISSTQMSHFCISGISHEDKCNCKCNACAAHHKALEVKEYIKKLKLGSTESQKEIAEAIARAKLTIKRK